MLVANKVAKKKIITFPVFAIFTVITSRENAISPTFP